MNKHEYADLMETEGDNGTLKLHNKEISSDDLYYDLKYDDEQGWRASNRNGYWYRLSDLEYREKQTPGEELEQELERCVENFIDGIDTTSTTMYIKQRYVYAWLEKHKDLLDKEQM